MAKKERDSHKAKLFGMYQSDEIGEQQKLEALKAGNQVAFSYFYHKYKLPLYSNILRLTKSHDLATELLQEVFVKLWQKRSFTDTEKDFRAYLYTIAQHTVYDFFRTASRQRKLREELIAANRTAPEYNPVDETLSYRESLEALHDGIAQLPPQCRHIFKLCKLEGMSHDEVASSLGISTATVNNHIVKATKILKRHLSYSHLVLLTALCCCFR